MKEVSDIKKGNLLELFSTGQNTKFSPANSDLTTVLSSLNIRVSRGIYRVNSIEDGKFDGIPIESFEPILITNEWLTKAKAIPQDGANITIGKLNFKRTTVALLFCNENFEPIPGERVISYFHQLQNIYKKKTGDDLIYELNIS